MPTFYRGAGLDTYWHTNDSREVGFTARAPDTLPTTAELITHIATNTMNSPYVSLTCSYRVAVSYAMLGGRRRPTREQPAYLYEIQINEPLPIGIRLIDPIKEIAPILPDPTVEEVHRYQHGGYPNFLLGIVHPRLRSFLAGQPLPSPQLKALVRALRDAEILILGALPASCVTNRFEIYAHDNP